MTSPKQDLLTSSSDPVRNREVVRKPLAAGDRVICVDGSLAIGNLLVKGETYTVMAPATDGRDLRLVEVSGGYNVARFRVIERADDNSAGPTGSASAGVGRGAPQPSSDTAASVEQAFERVAHAIEGRSHGSMCAGLSATCCCWALDNMSDLGPAIAELRRVVETEQQEARDSLASAGVDDDAVSIANCIESLGVVCDRLRRELDETVAGADQMSAGLRRIATEAGLTWVDMREIARAALDAATKGGQP